MGCCAVRPGFCGSIDSSNITVKQNTRNYELEYDVSHGKQTQIVSCARYDSAESQQRRIPPMLSETWGVLSVQHASMRPSSLPCMSKAGFHHLWLAPHGNRPARRTILIARLQVSRAQPECTYCTSPVETLNIISPPLASCTFRQGLAMSGCWLLCIVLQTSAPE